MKTENVVVLPYDPQWALEFIKLRDFLQNVCGSTALEIHHVGSTAVVGLCAKAILGVDLVIASLDDFDMIKDKLARVGYRHEGDLGISGREAFKYDSTDFMAHHLYVCVKDTSELKRHLAFRDHLRSHPKARDTYGQVKLKAALAHPHAIDAYMEEKNGIISSIYAQLESKHNH